MQQLAIGDFTPIRMNQPMSSGVYCAIGLSRQRETNLLERLYGALVSSVHVANPRSEIVNNYVIHVLVEENRFKH